MKRFIGVDGKDHAERMVEEINVEGVEVPTELPVIEPTWLQKMYPTHNRKYIKSEKDKPPLDDVLGWLYPTMKKRV